MDDTGEADPADWLPEVSYGSDVTRFEQDYPAVRLNARRDGAGWTANRRGDGSTAAEGDTLDEVAWRLNQQAASRS